jgi:hypothetical protein
MPLDPPVLDPIPQHQRPQAPVSIPAERGIQSRNPPGLRRQGLDPDHAGETPLEFASPARREVPAMNGPGQAQSNALKN